MVKSGSGSSRPVSNSYRNQILRAYLPVGLEDIQEEISSGATESKKADKIPKLTPSYFRANSRWSPVVSPGQYDVVMDGKRMDHAEQKIDLLPKETREFLLPLKQLYPTSVQIHLH